MTNQASEDGLDTDTQIMHKIDYILYSEHEQPFSKGDALLMLIRNQIKAHVRTEKLKLLDELDKSMPTAEQLTTIYGYHMPDKQYGYKLALHDIREVLAKMEAEL